MYLRQSSHPLFLKLFGRFKKGGHLKIKKRGGLQEKGRKHIIFKKEYLVWKRGFEKGAGTPYELCEASTSRAWGEMYNDMGEIPFEKSKVKNIWTSKGPI